MIKKYFFLILLFFVVILLKSLFFTFPPVNAGDSIVCTYTYGEWSLCNNYGYKTRTYSAAPAGCCMAPLPIVHEACPGTLITQCLYTYGEWNTCSINGCQYRTYSATPTNCFQLDRPVIYQTCNYSTSTYSCVYEYGSWSECNSSGYQTRTYSALPTGCYQTAAPVLSQTCNYTTSTIPCAYTYGEWSVCNSSGYQIRDYQAYPVGCYQSSVPVIHQYCTYNASTSPCSYTYSAWSVCNSSGYQTRTVLSKYPTGCYESTSPVLSQSCFTTTSSTIPCIYQYGDWSGCNTSGYQYRSYNATPTGCYQTAAPVLSQTCTYSSSTACSYTYSAWSACTNSSTMTGVNSDYYQTRTVLSKYPADCSIIVHPVLYQKCIPTSTSTTYCSYSYGEWSACNNGYQTRKYAALPLDCIQSQPPILRQACSSTSPASPCLYTYGSWSDCNSSGYQTRTVLSKYPAGCDVVDYPQTKRECEYVVPPETIMPVIPVCRYEYSSWSDCVSDKQTRMIISRLPIGCRDSAAPVLHQACKSPIPPTEPIIPVGAPVPVPNVVLVPEIVNNINFNGRTGTEWQKYYFGQEECRQKDICGGQADPDKDGLDNNEEYRFGTNPKKPDTDRDGYVDADEVEKGRNPIVASTKENVDRMVFESVKEKGEVKKELYQVKNVELVTTEKEQKSLKITGKALPNTYVTVFIYSDPIVLTIKTDSEGNWTYTLEKPLEEGDHEVYVAVTDNEGKVVAKSEPLVFVQTAEAAIMSNLPPIGVPDKNEVSPTKAWFKGNYTVFIILGFLGILIAMSAIGLMRSSKGPEDNIKQ